MNSYSNSLLQVPNLSVFKFDSYVTINEELQYQPQLTDDLMVTTDHTLDMHESAESFNYEQKLCALEEKYKKSNYRVLIQSRHMSKSMLSESTTSEKKNIVQRLLKLKPATVKVSEEKFVIVTFRSFEAYKDALNLWPLKSYLEGVSDTACIRMGVGENICFNSAFLKNNIGKYLREYSKKKICCFSIYNNNTVRIMPTNLLEMQDILFYGFRLNGINLQPKVNICSFFVKHFLENQRFVEELHQINDSKRQRLLEISDKLLEKLDKKNQEVEELCKYTKWFQNKTIVNHLNLH